MIIHNKVVTCSITNAKSGLCSEDCAFCAQSAHHETGISAHPLLSEKEMVDNALSLYESGATEFSMVTSGYALTDQELERIGRAAGAIKEKTGMLICSSLGVLTEERARQLKKSGLSAYHHNLETARSFFDQVCTTHDYEDDVQTVRAAKAAGLKVCSGGILGLGETWEQRVELSFALRDLDVDSIPINFLNPIPGTRMASRPLFHAFRQFNLLFGESSFRTHEKEEISDCFLKCTRVQAAEIKRFEEKLTDGD